MAAMAAVAVGMFVGTWVIGPAITRDTAEAPARRHAQERTDLRGHGGAPRSARPIAPRRRLSTSSGPPNYAAAAKEKAQAELGGQIVPTTMSSDRRRMRG